jgi:transposase
MRAQWRELDRRIAALDAEFAASARNEDAARRLATIPGIGTLSATALVAAVGDARAFARGRDLAAWLGLVPRQATTGGKPRLLGITKRGNNYLRTILIHGARSALRSLKTTEGALGDWIRALGARTHQNVVVVALAAKLARIAWAVLRSAATYDTTMHGRPVPA